MTDRPNSLDTPVAIFVYNRPEPTRRVLDRVRSVDPPRLLVVADGPVSNDETDRELCEWTRRLVRERSANLDVERNYAESNMGLRQRLSTGLDWVFDRVDEAIILEDDVVPERSFFRFCEAMLDRYRDDERVMEITGRNQLETWERTPYDYHFSYYGGVWGWATWASAWAEYDPKMTLWTDATVRDRIKDVVADDEQFRYLRRVYDRTHAGEERSWAYSWGFARHRNSGLSVVPSRNLVANIGFGEGATNTQNTFSGFAGKDTFEMAFPLDHPPFVAPDREYDQRFHRLRPARWKAIRGVHRIVDLLGL